MKSMPMQGSGLTQAVLDMQRDCLVTTKSQGRPEIIPIDADGGRGGVSKKITASPLQPQLKLPNVATELTFSQLRNLEEITLV